MKKIVAEAIGICIQVAGESKFLRLAEEFGWLVVFLWLTSPINRLLETTAIENADRMGGSLQNI